MFEVDFKMLDIVYFDHTQDGFAERGWLALGFAEHRCVIRRVHAHGSQRALSKNFKSLSITGTRKVLR